MPDSDRSSARHVVFVHDWDPAAASADVIVALTPCAYEAALAAGCRPFVVDDFVDRRPVIDRSTEYLRWQRGWLARLDQLAQADGAVVTAALSFTTPLNSVVVKSWVLRAAVDALKPHRITYIGLDLGSDPDPAPHHAGHLQFWPTLGDAPLASRVLPLIAAEANLPLDKISTGHPPLPAARHKSRRANLRRWMATQRNASSFARLRARTALFLWSSGYGMRVLASQVTRGGRSVVLLQRGADTTRVLRATPWGLRPLSPEVPIRAADRRPVPAAALALLEEVDSWSGVAGSGRILEARLRLFLEELCTSVMRIADRLDRDLERLGVEQVAAANPSSVEEFGALLAASRCEAIQRVLVQHGDHLFPVDSWFSEELQNFDVVLTSDSSLVSDLREASERLGAPCPAVRTESPRINAVRPRNRPAGVRYDHRRTVCYLPSFMTGDGAVAEGTFFDDAWYHRWHRRLLDHFVAHAEVDVVWKALPSSNATLDPLPQLLEAAGLSNVRYVTDPFLTVLRDVDAVVTDFPSTGLYEAAHFEKPILAIVFSRFARVRPGARQLFGNVIRDCSDEEAALAAIDEFIEGEPDRWRVPSELILSRP